jgi:nitroreductase
LPDELYEAMRCAPSTRHFTDEPVPRDMLERVLDNAHFAPSGGNRQGWRVIVVADRDTRRRLRELYEPQWAAYTEQTGVRALLEAAEPPPGHHGRADADAARCRRVRARV